MISKLHKRFFLLRQRMYQGALMLCVLQLFLSHAALAQSSITTGLPSAPSSLSGTTVGITWAMQNNNTSPITITGLDFYMSAANGAQTWTLWYSSTSLSGTTSITTPTFTQIASVSAPAPTATAIIPLFTSLSFVIPASTTYRFAITTTGSSINYGGAGTTTNIFSTSGVDLLRGDYQIASANVGWAASSFTTNISPRFFCGTVYFNNVVGPPCTTAPNTPTISTAAMTTPICTNGTKTISGSVASPPTNLQYQWEQSATSAGPWVNASSGTGATTVSYTSPTLTGNIWYRLKAICGTFTSTSAPYEVVVSPPPSVSIASSISNPVCPASSITFTATPLNAGSLPNFAWTKNGLPVGTNSATYTGSSWANGDVITVAMTAPNSCQSATAVSPTTPITLVINPALGTPAAITGPADPCPNSSAIYTLAPVTGASSYNWTLPVGWSITSGAGTNTIIAATGATSGSVSVSAANNCGNVSSTASLAVAPTTFVTPPIAITGNANPCVGATVQYSVPAAVGVTYAWTLPAGWVLSAGAGTNVITVTTAGNTGNVSAATVKSCGTSVPVNYAVAPLQNLTPSVTVSSSAAANVACSGTPVTFTANVANGGLLPRYQWQKNGVALPADTNAAYTTAGLVNGDVIRVSILSNAPCLTTANASSAGQVMAINPSFQPGININTNPAAEICAGSPIRLVTNVSGAGSTPAYQWFKNNNLITGATGPTYTATGVSNADTFTVSLASSEACRTQNLVMSNKAGVTVNQATTPVVSLSANPGTDVNAGQVVIFNAVYSGAGNQPSFQWFKNNVAIGTASGASYTTSNVKDGDVFRVQMVSSAPCSTSPITNSQSLVMRVATGIARANAEADVQVYPNPSGGSFMVMANWDRIATNGSVKVDLINTLGVMVYSTRVAASAQQNRSILIQLDDAVANGVYQLRVGGAEAQYVRTVLLQR